MRKQTLHYILMAVALILVLSFCINRDINIEKSYPSDLRNRVIGARLQMDGKLPYFYKWKTQDGLRYYDPSQIDTTYANSITASPFFHHLLYPIANLPQREISRIWLAIIYVMLFCCLTIAFLLAKTIVQRWACVIILICFLFTDGWTSLIMKGQLYMLIPFCCFIIFICLRKRQKMIFMLLAGVFSGILIFSRPTTILFFLPFISQIKKYKMSELVAFLIPILVFIGYSTFNTNERNFWIEYYHSINAQIKLHQATSNMLPGRYNPVQYQNWEGWNQDSIRKAKAPIIHGEVSNIAAVVRNIFHVNISKEILEITLLTTVIILLILFFKQIKHEQVIDLIKLSVFGFCLYLISDFLSPITRPEYNKVQWLFPLLLISAYYNSKLKFAYSIILVGLLLDVFFIPFLPMRHTIGEFVLLFTFLWLSFREDPKLFV